MARGDGEGGDDAEVRDDTKATDRPRLLLDVMLGKLATYLRMCGYDVAYALDRDAEADDRVLELAASEERQLLTRDRQLAARADDAVLLTTRDVEDQLRELRAAGFTLTLDDELRFCGRCNGHVERVEGARQGGGSTDRPDYVPEDGHVWRCRDCGQYFWKGSHWKDVAERLDGL